MLASTIITPQDLPRPLRLPGADKRRQTDSDMIIELAVYEKAHEQVLASVEDIERSLFGPGACSGSADLYGERRAGGLCGVLYGVTPPGWVKQHLSGRPVRGAEVTRRAQIKLLHIAQLAFERQCGHHGGRAGLEPYWPSISTSASARSPGASRVLIVGKANC